MFNREQAFLQLKIINHWKVETQWRIVSFILFFTLLIPMFEPMLPYIFPLLYLNEIHAIVSLNMFLSFFTLIIMVNFSFYLFYLADKFIKNYLFYNGNLLKIVYTIGFIYYIIHMLMSLFRLFQVVNLMI